MTLIKYCPEFVILLDSTMHNTIIYNSVSHNFRFPVCVQDITLDCWNL